MKNKLLTILLVSVLVFSSLNLALAAKQKCPTCGGTGKIPDPDNAPCTKCDGAGTISPKILMTSMTSSQIGETTVINATFKNMEDVDVTGKVTATIGEYSATSEETTFPSQQEISMGIVVNYNGQFSSLELAQKVHATAKATENITCPLCDGTGIAQVTCPDCNGKGYITDSAVTGPSSKTGTKTSGLDWTLIGSIVGVVVVLTAVGGGSFVLLKRRRPSEGKLRKMPSANFQTWILKMMDGKAASPAEVSSGIDGYSRANEPLAIKQSDSVGMVAVDAFAMALARNHARSGIIVAFGFADDAVRGKVRARTNAHVDIQLMTIQDMLYLRH